MAISVSVTSSEFASVGVLTLYHLDMQIRCTFLKMRY